MNRMRHALSRLGIMSELAIFLAHCLLCLLLLHCIELIIDDCTFYLFAEHTDRSLRLSFILRATKVWCLNPLSEMSQNLFFSRSTVLVNLSGLVTLIAKKNKSNQLPRFSCLLNNLIMSINYLIIYLRPDLNQ